MNRAYAISFAIALAAAGNAFADDITMETKPFVSTASLKDIGLYDILTRVAKGQADVDPFLLVSLREKGFVGLDSLVLTDIGEQALRGLTVQLGWFYPDE